MPKRPPRPVIATVSNRDMSALRAYWTVLDLDRGPRESHFWDLRYGMVNRWQSEDVPTPHIRYSLIFRRTDDVNDLEYAEAHGRFPGPPKTWKILFETGTFPEEFNEARDAWMNANTKTLERIEERDGIPAAWDYVDRNAPPERLPNPENWLLDRAAAELADALPRAVELYTGERSPIDWRPQGFIVSPPEEG